MTVQFFKLDARIYLDVYRTGYQISFLHLLQASKNSQYLVLRSLLLFVKLQFRQFISHISV
jgi:hypothetical protein